jgi:hypothetical protein
VGVRVCTLYYHVTPQNSASKTLTQKPHTHVFPSHMVVIVYVTPPLIWLCWWDCRVSLLSSACLCPTGQCDCHLWPYNHCVYHVSSITLVQQNSPGSSASATHDVTRHITVGVSPLPDLSVSVSLSPHVCTSIWFFLRVRGMCLYVCWILGAFGHVF